MSETPKLGHAPIKMRYFAERRLDDGRAAPGDFYWKVDEAGCRRLCVALPCKGGNYGLYCEWTIDHRNHCNAQWSWDGNVESPTLSPSLHAVGHWHGWVRNGELVEA